MQLTFGTGVYAGIYISQNYEVIAVAHAQLRILRVYLGEWLLMCLFVVLQVPRVDEPAKIWERLCEFAENHKKK